MPPRNNNRAPAAQLRPRQGLQLHHQATPDATDERTQGRQIASRRVGAAQSVQATECDIQLAGVPRATKAVLTNDTAQPTCSCSLSTSATTLDTTRLGCSCSALCASLRALTTTCTHMLHRLPQPPTRLLHGLVPIPHPATPSCTLPRSVPPPSPTLRHLPSAQHLAPLPHVQAARRRRRRRASATHNEPIWQENRGGRPYLGNARRRSLAGKTLAPQERTSALGSCSPSW